MSLGSLGKKVKSTLIMFEKFELITKFLSSLLTKKERPCLNLGDVVTRCEDGFSTRILRAPSEKVSPQLSVVWMKTQSVSNQRGVQSEPAVCVVLCRVGSALFEHFLCPLTPTGTVCLCLVGICLVSALCSCILLYFHYWTLSWSRKTHCF